MDCDPSITVRESLVDISAFRLGWFPISSWHLPRLLTASFFDLRIDTGFSVQGGGQVRTDVVSHPRLNECQHGGGEQQHNRQHGAQEFGTTDV